MRSSFCLLAFGLAALTNARSNDACINACLIDPNEGGLHECHSKCSVAAINGDSKSDEEGEESHDKGNNETLHQNPSSHSSEDSEQHGQSKSLRLRSMNSGRTGPNCVTQCVDQIEDSPCSGKAFNQFAYCIDSTCSDPYETTTFFLKSMHLAMEAMSSSDCTVEHNDRNYTLSLNSSCETVPFAFNSIKTRGLHASATSGQGCWVSIYGSEDCSGSKIEDTRVDRMANEHCVEKSGRSAAISCSSAGASAEAYLQALCSKDSENVDRIAPLVPDFKNPRYNNTNKAHNNDEDEDSEESGSSRTAIASLTYFALATMMFGAATVF